MYELRLLVLDSVRSANVQVQLWLEHRTAVCEWRIARFMCGESLHL